MSCFNLRYFQQIVKHWDKTHVPAVRQSNRHILNTFLSRKWFNYNSSGSLLYIFGARHDNISDWQTTVMFSQPRTEAHLGQLMNFTAGLIWIFSYLSVCQVIYIGELMCVHAQACARLCLMKRTVQSNSDEIRSNQREQGSYLL